MIEQQQNYVICRNEAIELQLDLSQGIFCRTLLHKAQGVTVHYDACTGELFRFFSAEGTFGTQDFAVEHVDLLSDETQELASVYAYCASLRLRVRLTITLYKSGHAGILLQSATDVDYPQELQVCCPFLVHLTLPDVARRYYPSSPLYRPHPLFTYPYVLADSADHFGFSVGLPSLSDLAPAVQNRNVDLWKISSQKALEAHRLPLRLGRVLSDTFELELTALQQGWREAFATLRQEQRKRFDLREHHRPQLQWLRDTMLHHFTYLYAKESYDYQQNKVDIDRLLEQGKEFGGYDTLTLWHQYPRLGVDARTQWDFFDDFPGGIEGLRDTIAQAHRGGAKVFLPYKPWDIGDDQSMDGTSDQLAQLVGDTDLDGLFLDTMNSVPAAFRPTIDAVKQGVAFCAEVHPGSVAAVDAITSSWGKSKAVDPIPMLDYFRFILPEHPVPIISRWATDHGKDRLVERAIFSATGLVIWQDIFGTWLPYSPQQKARIKAYKAVWQNNKDAFGGKEPIPLYPTLQPQILCNCFPADDGSATIFTFCNQSSALYHGPLVQLTNSAATLVPLFGEQAWLEKDILCGEVAPDKITAIRIQWNKEGLADVTT